MYANPIQNGSLPKLDNRLVNFDKLHFGKKYRKILSVIIIFPVIRYFQWYVSR